MKLSITFPLRTKSQNVNLRFGNPFARASSTKRERKETALALSQLPRPRRVLPGRDDLRRPDCTTPSRANTYQVTLTRIGMGLLDTDAVPGALKAVRDEIAAWLGIKDGPRDPAVWRVQQQQCPKGFFMVRIEIEDADPDPREVVKLLGTQPPWMTDAVSEGAPMWKPAARKAAKRARTTQQDASKGSLFQQGKSIADLVSEHEERAEDLQRLKASTAKLREARKRVGREATPRLDVSPQAWRRAVQKTLVAPRKAFYAAPWEQPMGDAVASHPVWSDAAGRWLQSGEDVLTPMATATDPPPAVLRLRQKLEDGRPYVAATLHRCLETHPELGGEVWIYRIDESPDGYDVPVRIAAKRAAREAARKGRATP